MKSFASLTMPSTCATVKQINAAKAAATALETIAVEERKFEKEQKIRDEGENTLTIGKFYVMRAGSAQGGSRANAELRRARQRKAQFHWRFHDGLRYRYRHQIAQSYRTPLQIFAKAQVLESPMERSSWKVKIAGVRMTQRRKPVASRA